MTLAKKIENILKDELKPEDVKTIVDMAEFLKYKSSLAKWDKINESEPEYITEDEKNEIDKKKASGDYVSQKQLLKELGISEDEIHR
ncbi:hypothetical protein BHU72_07555 [Desulfuribacillus stibiiarsenatis]|uniref:Uncharacterized protein n=2 Tax=Desulfuribacillus stibiiarsenatis TaxID=1390249 RepID=A0A1E5L3N0_9FIRM|nr:hypothetical protein BHU72_07555 [Desulfuribacillus stibiiarsenatis]